MQSFPLALSLLLSLVLSPLSASPPLLLLVSFDGFRFDLLNASTTPHMWRFVQEGVFFANGLRSQYITYTAPNHASIATGLYEESHGIVGNEFYDPDTKEKSVLRPLCTMS